MIKFEALNDIATSHVGKASCAIDARLKLEIMDFYPVACQAFAQSHKAVIKITGASNITDAMVKAEILGRVSMRSEFFVRPDWINREATWQTMESDEDADIRKHPISKSNALYRTRVSAKTLRWEDVQSLGASPCQFFQIVDLENTVGAFMAGAAPSVRFTSCDHPPDVATAQEFLKVFRHGCLMGGVGMAELEDGMAVSNSHQALQVLNASTIRFFNDAHKRFAVLTKDSYGREITSYGAY